MTVRGRSLRRARKQRSSMADGFIVTWDVDSADTAVCARLRRFIFGYVSRKGGRTYRYPGFVESDGVRYLGQSVVFVPSQYLGKLTERMRILGVEHLVTVASLGHILPN